VRASSEVISSQTTIYGINAPASISILGGSYSVNGGPFTSIAGTASNRDHVRVRVLSSPHPGQKAFATLTVGGVSGAFEVATYQPGATGLSTLYFLSSPGDWVGEGREELHFGANLAVTAQRLGDGVNLAFETPGPVRGRLLASGPGERRLSRASTRMRNARQRRPSLAWISPGTGEDATSRAASSR
jgi:hypothetical protein